MLNSLLSHVQVKKIRGFRALFWANLAFLILCSSVFVQCTTLRRQNPDETAATENGEGAPEASDPKSVATTAKENLVSTQQLENRIQTLEQQITLMNETVQSLRITIDNMMVMKKPKPTGVKEVTNSVGGVPVDSAEANRSQISAGNNELAFERYKSGLIQRESEKYPEAILTLSGFVEDFADHPLAGSAQFYVGESYYRQGELKIALEEFKRVLISYDRSPHLSDTLKRLVEIETKLNMSREASQHTQILSSLFKMSPATELPMVKTTKVGAKTAQAPESGEPPPATTDLPATSNEEPQAH